MADYNKQTVAQLRQLLKDRGIPSTGLTRKAQIIEKLEEKDATEGGEGTEEVETVDAPPDPVAQVQEEAEDAAEQSEDASGPALSEAGEPKAQPAEPSAPAPMPTATVDANRETISHIDSDTPPPSQTKAIEKPAEHATMDEEPGTIQPAEVFNTAPADPDVVVGPKITEPEDTVTPGESKGELAEGELPEAPGPASESLRFARQDEQSVTDTAMEDKMSTPGLNEEPSVEKAELPTIPERSTAETSRLNTEELEADSRKRKRRSGSPDLPIQDVRAKKHRPSQEPAPEVHLKEDEDVVMEQRPPMEDASTPQNDEENTNGTHHIEAEQAAIEPPIAQVDSKPPRKEKTEKTDRYKNLVKPSAASEHKETLQDDRNIAPALHPATPALYIRNFMRPLRPEQLRTHLVSLASPPSSSPDTSIVQKLFLDAMKTHALILFTTTAAASRVRASLHGSVWPPEGMRKELWVDFIPEESVSDWIQQEEDAVVAEKEARGAGRPIPVKRFEVVYTDGEAVFQELGSNAPPDAPRGPRGSIDARRASQHAPVTEPTPDTRQDIAASFKTLDQLFSSTTAKPQLYFLPVSDEIAETRQRELDAETSRDWAPGETRKGRGIKTEMKYKYSFDSEDRIEEIGEDRGPWAEDYNRGRGGFRGRGRGGRGRGGMWRG